jgi:hypothetical protein
MGKLEETMRIRRQKKRPQWHVAFKKQFGRYPHQFEVFMRTAMRNLERR